MRRRHVNDVARLRKEFIPYAGTPYDRDSRAHGYAIITATSTLNAMTLREALHAHIPTLTTESTVRDAVDKMDVYQFPALVVVDEDMAPIGVVTEGDLCRAATANDNFTTMSGELAYVYASKSPTIAPPDTEIGDAFHRMLMSGLTVLPVVENSRLIGVVLRVDLMQAMLLDS